MTQKTFTLQEANELLPTLEIKLTKLLQIKKQMTQTLLLLEKKGVQVEDLFAMTEELDDDCAEIKKELEKLGALLNASLSEIQGYGCFVKDLDLGLIDFYSTDLGQEIFYCWQLGEKEIRYWHSINEGFSSRKPLFDDQAPQEKTLH